MRRNDRWLLEAATAALAFARANPPSTPSHRALVDDLGTIIGRAGGRHGDQVGRRSANRAVRAKRRTERKGATTGVLRHVVSAARLAAGERPDLFGGVRLPRAVGSYEVFRARAENLLRLAKEHTELLGKYGLGPNALADLEAQLTVLDALSGLIYETHGAHVGATADIRATVAKITEILAILDVVYRFQFASDPDKLAAWASARRVVTVGSRKQAPTEPPGGKAQTA